MFKVSELNSRDKTLDEIHKIQRKISLKIKGLSIQKQADFFNESARELNKRYNCSFKFIKTPSMTLA